MRAVFLLIVLFILALVCAAARGEDAEIPVRVLCEGGRVAVIQLVVREPGVYTIALPADACEAQPQEEEGAAA